ncbi:MAG: DUF1573 domain-containing protein [Phycisphaerales bacterium JB065]
MISRNAGHRTLPFVIATLLVAMLGNLAAAQSGSGRRITTPPVSVENDTVDFGDVAPNTTVKRKATLTNNSENQIRITGVRVSCGCTVADWPEEWIQPGESVEVELTFQSGELWGPIRRYALLVFEGYNRPLRITTVAHVNTGIRASREYEPLGQFFQGTITLTSTDGKPFSVRSLSFATPGEDDEAPAGVISRDDLAEALKQPALVHRIPFDFSKVDPLRLRRWVAIETDHPTAPVVAMHIDNPYAGVDQRRTLWIYNKDHLRLGSAKPGEPVEETVVLKGLRTAAELQEVHTGDPNLRVEVVSTELNPAMGLHVVLRFIPSEGAQGLIHTGLTIRAVDFEDTIEVMLRVPNEDTTP